MRLILALILPLWCNHALAVTDAAQAKLNKEGFRALSELATVMILDDLNQEPMGDFVWDSGAFGNVYVHDVRLTVDFHDLNLEPTSSGLAARVGMGQTKITIGRVQAFRGYWWEATCHGVEIVLSDGAAYAANATLKPSVIDQSIHLSSESFDLGRSGSEIQTYGPAWCEGYAFLSWVMRWVAEQAIYMGRHMIPQGVEGAITGKLPELASMVDQLARQEIPIDLGEVSGVEMFAVTLKTHPESVAVNDEAMLFTLGAEVVPDRKEKGAKRPEPAIPLGFVGINLEVISDLINHLIIRPGEWVEVNAELLPELRSVLKRQYLAAVWPELLEADFDRDDIRLMFMLEQGLVADIDDETQTVAFAVPSLALRLQVYQDGGIRDFFDLNLNVAGQLEARVSDTWLGLGFPKQFEYGFQGDWADGYEPIVGMFEADVFESILATLLDYLVVSGDVYRFEIPSLPLSTGEVKIGRINMEKPWIQAILEKDEYK